jgi:hypothetical protein
MDDFSSSWELERLEDPNARFAEIARELPPGGKFSFITLNKNSVQVFLQRYKTPLPCKANDLKTLRRIAQKYGLIPVVLRLKADPSRTSFFSKIPWSLSKPHIVGVFQKVS